MCLLLVMFVLGDRWCEGAIYLNLSIQDALFWWGINGAVKYKEMVEMQPQVTRNLLIDDYIFLYLFYLKNSIWL